ncbi:MAG: Asp-tRNA(Asn)/Glu-tRNA(Gln) amidotransferase subunit GatB [Polyangiaceae bacterium]|nr:Asp-tRNA(Asn)/Glu-tRNA(Gln) amidotransferase subunit GatB [Polyangiaceae bacterium]
MAVSYEPVIGLEVHAQLQTKSKLFCGCSTEFGKGPNSNVCPVCLGLPGALPVLNGTAVEMAVRAALALDCTIAETSIFARKNYFYPDLPKGYQISQYDLPLCSHGHLDVPVETGTKRIGITRIHMEEDAGKNVHGVGGDSAVDLNRAGVPLIEIVSEPDLRSSSDAANYLRTLRDILVAIGVNDGNLEEGSFRCDANVSIRPVGQQKFGTRCELKNINSFRFVQRAIDSEIARQTAVLDAGGTITQETRSFDPETGLTKTLRSKEDAHDYRYFPEPDLPSVRVTAEMIAAERPRVQDLPLRVRARWVDELGLTPATAQTLSQHPGYVQFFEAARRGYADAVKLANFMQTEVLRGAKVHGLKAEFTVSAEQVAELLSLVEAKAISGKQAKDVFAAMEGTTLSPREIVKGQGMAVISSEEDLIPVCESLIAQYPKQKEQFLGGKTAILGFFVGQVMKETKGRAEPELVAQLLPRLLKGEAS